MEAPFQMRNTEEEEGVMIGMDLKTRRRSHSHHNHHHNHKLQTASPTSSESSITSESSHSSFEGVLGVQNEHLNGTANGTNDTVIEGGSVIQEGEGEVEGQVELEPVVENEMKENLEEPMKEEDERVLDSDDVSFSTNQGTNGVYVHENGDTVAYSLPESNVVKEEITASNSSLSRSPDTMVGLKDLESLLDESSSSLNIAATDAYNALEDTLNNTFEGVEHENGQLGLPKDCIPEIQGIYVERVRREQVFPLDDSKRVKNENGHLDLPNEPLPEVEEFDVERVVLQQETHDFYCPNCNSCITKRVILKRRKRKIQEISSGDDIGSFNQAQPEIPEGSQPDMPPSADEPIYAITCLSCFSIFLPSQNGWLHRIFGRKPEVPVQSDDSLTKPLVPSEGADGGATSTDVDVGKGNVFPLWIVNCCQPSEKRPVHLDIPEPSLPPKPETPAKPGTDLFQPILPVLSEPHYPAVPDEPSMPPQQPEPPVPGTCPFKPIEPVPSDPHYPAVPDYKPLSPSTDSNAGTHPFQPIAPVPPEPQHPAGPDGKPSPLKIEPISGNDPSHTSKPKPPIKPDHNEPLQPAPKPTPDEPLPTSPKPSLGEPLLPAPKPAPENGFALWFLNCCQTHRDGPHAPGNPGVGDSLMSKPKPPSILDEVISSPREPEPAPPTDTVISSPREPGPAPPTNTGSPSSLSATPVTRLDGGTSLSPEPTLPTYDDAKPLPPGPALPIRPVDSPFLRKPKPPVTTDTGGHVTIPMPYPGSPNPSSSTMSHGDVQPGGGPSAHTETPRGDDASPPDPIPEVGTGVGVINAIVYGGLLECITSLSVITSAAGGDATTLNIVALGLANVFGGFILLFHNLRVLKREHGMERYIEQLGRPGHFRLHATVAVVSYLIFGLMAPVLYGFTFRKSDNKDYKLITLAATSLTCITFLSIAKAYARRPSKQYIQTVLYYFNLGFTVSGIGYVSGHFINMLLKKLGVFDASSAQPAAGDMNGIWASY